MKQKCTRNSHFLKIVTLIFDHKQKGLVTRYTYVKHKGPNSYQSKGMANVKVTEGKQTDKKTDGQTDRLKTICPRSINVEA